MAAAFEGFSIREYASKMRSENVAKSWPFGGDVEKKQIESILPPITITKFRWWLHELESARSCHDCTSDAPIQEKNANRGAEILEAPPLGCTECGSLGDPSMAATLTAHTGNCLVSEEMKHRAKSKSKAPKKRSIVEIFAVAAQIETAANKASSNRVGEASSSRNSNSICSKRRKKKNKKKKSLLDKTRLLSVNNMKFKKKRKKKKKKRKRKNHRQDVLITRENAYKLEQEIASNWARNFNCSTDGMYTGSISDGRLCRKNLKLKSSSSHTKHEANMPSKFCKRLNKLHVPVRGILKKQGKFLVNNSDSQNVVHLEKHVKFLDNVEVQGSPQNSPTSTQQSDGYARLSGVDKLIGSDEEFSLVEVTSSDDEDPVLTKGGNRTQATLEKEHLADTLIQGNTENYLSPRHASSHNCSNSLLLKSNSTRLVSKCCKDFHASIIKGKSVVVDDSTAMESSRFLTSGRGAQDTGTNLQTLESPLGCNIVPSHAVCGMSVIQSPRTSSQSTPTRLFLNENLNGSFSFQSHSAIEDTSAHPVVYQQLRPQRPVSLFSGAFTFTDQWNPRPCSLTEECTYNDLWGLPLNSHGELIQMNSTSSSNFLVKRSSGMVSGSFHGQNLIGPSNTEEDFGSNSGNYGQRSGPRDLNLFPMHNCDSRGPSADNFWQTPRRHVSACSLNTDLNLVNVSFDVCGHHAYDSVQDPMNQAIPSIEKDVRVSPNATPVTMRLMGKDVAIARSATQDTEDENIWTDKEMIIEHQQQEDPFTLSSTLQKSEGSANNLFEHQRNLPWKSLVKAHNSLLLNPYINWPSDSVPQRDRFPLTRSSNYELQPNSHLSFNFTNLREPLVSDPRLALPSLPPGSSQCIHWAPNQNYHQHPPHPRASGFDFPFLCDDCVEYKQQEPIFRSPFKGVPSWLHSSDQVRSTPTANSLAFPDEIQRSYLSQTPPSRFNSSVTFTTYSPIDPLSHLRGPFGPSTAVRSQLLEAVPGIEPISADKVSYRSRIESTNRLKSPAFGVRTPDLCARTKKRPAVKPVDPLRKLDKMPNLGRLKNPSIDASPRKETFYGEVECRGGVAIRLDSSLGKSSNIEYLPDGNVAQKDGRRNFTGTERFSTGETAWPGPTKLGAGARHTLKPTQTMNKDGSRSIHPMVSFGGVPNYMMVPESQAKPTRRYEI